MMCFNKIKLFLFLVPLIALINCSKSGISKVRSSGNGNSEVSFWLTKGNQQVLLQKQESNLTFVTVANNHANIEIDDSKSYQTIDGFGYTLTGGSCQLINKMKAAAKAKLLQELFGNGINDISISYLRISIGASDMDAEVFSYNDLPAGKTDLTLQNFSLKPDKAYLIPLLKAILKINPKIKILATSWSPPVWMKDNGQTIGGSLKPEYYQVYAQYFVKYIQQMKAEGIVIDAITPQNEPLNPKNNPSMFMTAIRQAEFIKNNLGPAFRSAGITTKIITYDHNCDEPDYPQTVLSDPKAYPFIDGSAFHLYNGNISALSVVHNAYPEKKIYFTEQYTDAKGEFGGDLKWHMKNVIIGSMRNWSRNALEWNLANDPLFEPHTPGGCTTCKGAVTINSNGTVTRNVSYYIVAHASKFVPAGSVRIESNIGGNLQTAAFKTPSGNKVLIAENDGNEAVTFNIIFNKKGVTTTLEGGAVGTYIW